jgi:hypothetical protein
LLESVITALPEKSVSSIASFSSSTWRHSAGVGGAREAACVARHRKHAREQASAF